MAKFDDVPIPDIPSLEEAARLAAARIQTTRNTCYRCDTEFHTTIILDAMRPVLAAVAQQRNVAMAGNKILGERVDAYITQRDAAIDENERLRTVIEDAHMKVDVCTELNFRDVDEVRKIVKIDHPGASLLAELERLRLMESEHKRLHGKLNKILHPKGDGPKSPALCDLVSYVQTDLTDMDAEIADQ